MAYKEWMIKRERKKEKSFEDEKLVFPNGFARIK
jgi:hypothetical protein